DEVRGRDNAVNMVFVGASNELGEFRAGTMESFIGPVTAVVIGGAGTLAVASIWARSFPQLQDRQPGRSQALTRLRRSCAYPLRPHLAVDNRAQIQATGSRTATA